MTRNDSIQQKAVAMGEATAFTSMGNSSLMTAHGKGPRPQQYVTMNSTSDITGRKLMLGTTGLSMLCNKKKVPRSVCKTITFYFKMLCLMIILYTKRILSDFSVNCQYIFWLNTIYAFPFLNIFFIIKLSSWA